MTKMDVIDSLASIDFVCDNEQDDVDRKAFEPMILRSPELGKRCLDMWISKYYVSFKSKALIERYELEPTWDNFHLAAHWLMIDRIVAAVALDGNVKSCVKECIALTLKCGNIDYVTLAWVEFYANVNQEAKVA